ncbi:Rab proteins geranylgeranyltransferase component A 1 [Lamellibrachia satsuma]|nr:Rab proteins geranylgeranyltransferase component A 1 [Lamellibrachia satsuma]
MADDKLPSDYDAIVLGTGMTECIVAAALSRIGQSVLHIDRNDYYSGDWASFHFESLHKWIAQQRGDIEQDLTVQEGSDPTTLFQEGETTLPLRMQSNTISSVIEHIHVMEDRPEEQPKVEGYTEGHMKGHTEGHMEGHTEGHTSTKTSVHNPLQVSEADLSCQSSDVTDSSNVESSVNLFSNANKTHASDTTGCSDTDIVTDTGTVDQMTMSLDALTTNDVEELTSVSTSSVDDGVEVTQEGDKTGGCVDDLGLTAKEDPETIGKQPTFREIKQQWRKFSIDLMPKVLYCRGSMVELLIKSDIAKYCEFKSVTRVLTLLNGKLQQVPCSRADVFSSKQVSMIEKRMLMKLLTFCLEFDKHPVEYRDYEDKPFTEFLQSRKLTANVRHYVQNSIAMATEETSTLDGLKSTQRFLQSLGRYGNTAFLWPLYGSGELPQCFCRMCAVFGGIYCLRRSAQSLVVNESKRCTGIIDTEGQRLNCRWLIMESSYASTDIFPQHSHPRQEISRGILLTNKSIQPTSQEEITLLRLPAGDGRAQPITVYELAPCSMACPSGFYLVHMTCQSTADAETDLASTVQQLFQENCDEDIVPAEEDTKPCVLWSVYFNMADNTSTDHHCDVADNVIVVSGPDASLDFEHSIAEARKIFEQICGMEEEFLPAAPDPEDIIYDDREGKTPADSGFSTGDVEEEKGVVKGNGTDTSGEVVGEVDEGKVEWEKTEEEGKEGCDVLEEPSEGGRGKGGGDT